MSDPMGRMVDNPAYDAEPKHHASDARQRLRDERKYVQVLLAQNDALRDTLAAVREWAEINLGHPLLYRQLLAILDNSDPRDEVGT